jgi:hypothetical protein
MQVDEPPPGTTPALIQDSNSDLADFRTNPDHDPAESRHVVDSAAISASAGPSPTDIMSDE